MSGAHIDAEPRLNEMLQELNRTVIRINFLYCGVNKREQIN